MNAPEVVNALLNAKSFCVIGASRDTSKFGYQVYRALKSDGRTAYAVNPNTDLIGKSPCYPTVNDLPAPVEVAVFVVPPESTEAVLPECLAAGIKNIWMQPGAESSKAVEYCRDNDLALVYGGPCLLTLLWGDLDE